MAQNTPKNSKFSPDCYTFLKAKRNSAGVTIVINISVVSTNGLLERQRPLKIEDPTERFVRRMLISMNQHAGHPKYMHII